jgi:hypothetical protein
MFFLLFLFSIQVIKAQYSADLSVEGGSNYVSSGFYSDVSGEFSVKISDWRVTSAAGVSFSGFQENIFNALKMDVSKDFMLKKTALTGHVFYQWRPFSTILHEHNAGLVVHFLKKKFGYQLGINTRVFNLINQYSASNNYARTSIWEPFNLMYKISWQHQLAQKWDLNASVTNFDAFMIQQETNPMLIANVAYLLSPQTKIYFDAGYLQAGLMNIRVNYFGYFIRAGIQWQL